MTNIDLHIDPNIAGFGEEEIQGHRLIKIKSIPKTTTQKLEHSETDFPIPSSPA